MWRFCMSGLAPMPVSQGRTLYLGRGTLLPLGREE